IVVIFAPTAVLTGTMQERIAAPLICTVQAPHCAMPQPYLVPVSPSCSRSTQSSGVFGSPSTSWGFPLTVKRTIALPPPSGIRSRLDGSAATLGRDPGGGNWFCEMPRRSSAALRYDDEHRNGDEADGIKQVVRGCHSPHSGAGPFPGRFGTLRVSYN